MNPAREKLRTVAAQVRDALAAGGPDLLVGALHRAAIELERLDMFDASETEIAINMANAQSLLEMHHQLTSRVA
jgi:hypothetical protein